MTMLQNAAKAKLRARMRRIVPAYNPADDYTIGDYVAHFVIGAAIIIVLSVLYLVIDSELTYDRIGGSEEARALHLTFCTNPCDRIECILNRERSCSAFFGPKWWRLRGEQR